MPSLEFCVRKTTGLFLRFLLVFDRERINSAVSLTESLTIEQWNAPTGVEILFLFSRADPIRRGLAQSFP